MDNNPGEVIFRSERTRNWNSSREAMFRQNLGMRDPPNPGPVDPAALHWNLEGLSARAGLRNFARCSLKHAHFAEVLHFQLPGFAIFPRV